MAVTNTLNAEDPLPARPQQPGERELLDRIAMQDRVAFRDLYLAYHRRLSRFLLRFVRKPETVEEIINDTMFIVWRKAGDFRGDSQVSTWIMGIAYRQALKAIKRLEHVAHDEPVADAESLLAHDSGAAQREAREWIDVGLAALPPVQRIVIELAYFMGHSCEEIAVITDCPVNTVKTRMFHARERLRTLLPEQSSLPRSLT
jgi:RNA polymerase sigma-70 factor, ECF subfamily